MKKKVYFLLVILLIPIAVCPQNITVEWAKIQGPHLAQVKFTEKISLVNRDALAIKPELPIVSISMKDNILSVTTTQPFALDVHYYLTFNKHEAHFLVPDGILDSLYSEKPLGFMREDDRMVFRVFAPRAKWLRLVHFDNYKDSEGYEFSMKRDEQGVWEFFTEEDWTGSYYAYRLWGPTGEGEMFDSTIVIADPYSRAVVTQNNYHHPGKTLIIPPDDFNWEGTRWQEIPRRDLIIYEMHVRDMTAHPSSGLPEGQRGYYTSLIDEDQEGGLPYIRQLGVNAVELLPTQDFGNIEVPYMDHSAPVYNTWNPYERNHWGYMTSYYFAPESYYASGGTMERGRYNGGDGRQVREFKEMVKTFHKNGVAVIMDVVYNHVSEYDYNPLKYIDKFYYFRLNKDCSFTSVSGCGNDLKTERPMARRLILESVKYWMKEYRVDGFRFDLANMLDRETCRQILSEARKINPYAIIIAEPWGGGYDPSGFSDIGWASWNDQIRNGVKGWNPTDSRGFIFGEFQGENNRASLERYVKGSLRRLGGQYVDVAHSVNYLASHDDHTLGDFVRIGRGEVDENARITDLDKNARLTPRQMALNKLAALFLFTSQGATMIHEGQEFARSKIIVKTDAPDENRGRIDHNSYEKDNATNYLNFNYGEMNRELVDYYRGLIRLRKQYDAFRRAAAEDIKFFQPDDPFLLSYLLNYNGQIFLVAMNGNPKTAHEINVPGGEWVMLVDGNQVYPEGSEKEVPVLLNLPPSTGIVLRKK